MMKNDGLKMIIGIAIGTALGAAIAYFSDEKKRNDFIDDVSDMTDTVKGNVKDAYYDARIRGRKAKRDIERYAADLKDSASNVYEEVKGKAKKLKGDAEEKVEELSEQAGKAVRETKEKVEAEIKNQRQ